MEPFRDDLLWKNISELPYFRGFLRAIEARYYQSFNFQGPVLDLGCGDGNFAQITFCKKIDIGLDPLFLSLIEAKGRKKYHLLVCAEGTRLPFPIDYFASTYSNSVLEHIKPVEDVIREIYRVVRRGGLFTLTVPNKNFVNNLSVAMQFEKMNLKKLAERYRKIFNYISRHFHTDSYDVWLKRFLDKGFIFVDGWNYFSKEALKILEWGHLFGIPSWITKKLFGKWILINNEWNLNLVYLLLKKQYHTEQRCPEGAYSFLVLKK